MISSQTSGPSRPKPGLRLRGTSGNWPFLGVPSLKAAHTEDPAHTEEPGKQPEGSGTSNGGEGDNGPAGNLHLLPLIPRALCLTAVVTPTDSSAQSPWALPGSCSQLPKVAWHSSMVAGSQQVEELLPE